MQLSILYISPALFVRVQYILPTTYIHHLPVPSRRNFPPFIVLSVLFSVPLNVVYTVLTIKLVHHQIRTYFAACSSTVLCSTDEVAANVVSSSSKASSSSSATSISDSDSGSTVMRSSRRQRMEATVAAAAMSPPGVVHQHQHHSHRHSLSQDSNDSTLSFIPPTHSRLPPDGHEFPQEFIDTTGITKQVRGNAQK